MESITIHMPDDFHVHLRSGKMLKTVLPFTSEVFARAVVMGNLPKPITTAADITKYRKEILTNLKGKEENFKPIMSVMLVKKTTPELIQEAYGAGAHVLKLIPSNTSTLSAHGIPLQKLEKYYPVLEMAQKLEMIFSCHFEQATDEKGHPIPALQREQAALPYLEKIAHKFPALNIVAEHASTKELITLVNKLPHNVAATLTVHHALITHDDMSHLNGVIKDPFLYCNPIAKREHDCEAVIEAMVSGNPKYFFGSDSAPHLIKEKESANPPAGIFSAPIALPMLTEIFERKNALEKLENFVSFFGAKFYRLPINEHTLTLIKSPWTVPAEIDGIKIFLGGHTLSWQLKAARI